MSSGENLKRFCKKSNTIYGKYSAKIRHLRKRLCKKQHLWKIFCKNQTPIMEMILEYNTIRRNTDTIQEACNHSETVEYYLREH
jgi:hypothetical protein